MILRRIFVCLFGAAALVPAAEMWPLEKLYARPYVWGTKPAELAWSKRGHVLGFLWNAEGGRFLDLYAYHADTRKLSRVTDLENWKDDLLKTADEKDARKSRYLLPPAGLNGFVLSADGKQTAFSFKGELFIAPTDGSAAPFRLTRTKEPELDPQFSPSGTQLAAVRHGQVVIQNFAASGQLWQVTDIAEPASLEG